jgi:hypothetical protein
VDEVAQRRNHPVEVAHAGDEVDLAHALQDGKRRRS